MKKSKISYFEKLKDPRWQKKRLETLDHFNFECSSCGSSDKTLNVHHLYYKKNAEPWEYEVGTELFSLCEDCHKYEHEAEDRFQKSLRKFKLYSGMLGYNIDTITGVLDGMILGAGPDDLDLEIISAEHAAGVSMANWLPYRDGEQLIISLATENNRILNAHRFAWETCEDDRKESIRGSIKRGFCSIKTYKDFGDYIYWPDDFIKEIEGIVASGIKNNGEES